MDRATADVGSEAVKRAARELGFDLVGVAAARPLDPAFLTRWIDEGWSAGLGYMAERTAERLDPGAIVPGAKSVVALAVNYHVGERALGDAPPGAMTIARYARGSDYHLYLRRRVRKLRKRMLALFPGARVHPSVDTSPVAEKVWAALAGLGWIGRNGLLITRGFGSWVLLATLITDVELAPDAPHPSHCGECRACLPACPTGALPGDGRVDARRCLSTWTIEKRGPVPEDLWEAASTRHFGCDVCQEVCPWNKFAKETARREVQPFPIVRLRCSELLERTQAELEAALVGSALKRPGIAGLRRNAALGLAAQGDADARRTARALSEDGDEVVRDAARWALERLERG